MFKIYLKIADQESACGIKSIPFINIAGLAMGIAAFLLILEYVSFEKSMNQFHKNMASIYRLLNEDAKGRTWPQVEPGWAEKAKENFPEIKDYCRFEEGIGKRHRSPR